MTLSGGWLREVKPLSFIYEKARALPADVCAEAIRRFEASTDQQAPGRIGQAGEVVPQVKRSTDLRVSGREDWRDIDRMLEKLKAVTAEQVQAVAKKYFSDDVLTVATLDPQPVDPKAAAKPSVPLKH